MAARTSTVTFARPASERDRFAFGVTGDEDDYGTVEIVRKTTLTHYRSDGYPNKHKPAESTEEILATLSSHEAEHLTKTLVSALVEAIHVRKGAFE